jgi:hypothetical protein
MRQAEPEPSWAAGWDGRLIARRLTFKSDTHVGFGSGQKVSAKLLLGKSRVVFG